MRRRAFLQSIALVPIAAAILPSSAPAMIRVYHFSLEAYGIGWRIGMSAYFPDEVTAVRTFLAKLPEGGVGVRWTRHADLSRLVPVPAEPA